ncbi:hypothetical protein GUI12_00115 [Anaplasmataceae bacterium AB001_6]|nr:hypothetical protein GUI12_00115 [Anaplasmataceae bacterium AB001_6]
MKITEYRNLPAFSTFISAIILSTALATMTLFALNIAFGHAVMLACGSYITTFSYNVLRKLILGYVSGVIIKEILPASEDNKSKNEEDNKPSYDDLDLFDDEEDNKSSYDRFRNSIYSIVNASLFASIITFLVFNATLQHAIVLICTGYMISFARDIIKKLVSEYNYEKISSNKIIAEIENVASITEAYLGTACDKFTSIMKNIVDLDQIAAQFTRKNIATIMIGNTVSSTSSSLIDLLISKIKSNISIDLEFSHHLAKLFADITTMLATTLVKMRITGVLKAKITDNVMNNNPPFIKTYANTFADRLLDTIFIIEGRLKSVMNLMLKCITQKHSASQFNIQCVDINNNITIDETMKSAHNLTELLQNSERIKGHPEDDLLDGTKGVIFADNVNYKANIYDIDSAKEENKSVDCNMQECLEDIVEINNVTESASTLDTAPYL